MSEHTLKSRLSRALEQVRVVVATPVVLVAFYLMGRERERRGREAEAHLRALQAKILQGEVENPFRKPLSDIPPEHCMPFPWFPEDA